LLSSKQGASRTVEKQNQIGRRAKKKEKKKEEENIYPVMCTAGLDH
jgi:hypothetical protein